MIKQKIAIIGGGPSAMMLAASLDNKLYDISVYEKGKALGRKFLVAGDGGLNLTHSEGQSVFYTRYTPSDFFKPLIENFSNSDLVQWLKGMGIETYIGSSKRVFPVKGIKPIEVLNSIIKKLEQNNVAIHYEHEWVGWGPGKALCFKTRFGNAEIIPDITVFALGGASWPVTGSNGNWTKFFSEKNIKVNPFQSSNCSYKVKWHDNFISHHEGHPLKNISISCNGIAGKGEVVLTRFGIEGSGIYRLSHQIRTSLHEKGEAIVYIDLRPLWSVEDIQKKLSSRNKKSRTAFLSVQLNLNSVQLALIKDVTSKEEFSDPMKISEIVKNIPVRIIGSGPIEKAISTAGGIDLCEINSSFELNKLKNSYVIGEMLDWDAPTGGYLLQGCFSMGAALASYLNRKMENV